MSRFTFLSVAAILSTIVVSPAMAAGFTTWNSANLTTATGTIADPNGPISVTFSRTEPNGFPIGIEDSSTFGTFSGGKTTADIYQPDAPGTDDFLSLVSISNSDTYTVSFSQAVIDPIFHVYNLDFRNYNFSGGITPTVISGLNLAAAGNVVGDNDPATFDDGWYFDANKGNPDGSAYGSFKLSGTFTQISWTSQWVRPSTDQFADGNFLGISAAAPTSVPEPGSLGLIGAATLFGISSLSKRKLSDKQ